MLSVLGWAMIALTFAATSLGLIYPCYRVARRSFPGSRKIRWIYCGTAAVFAIALWVLIPVFVHSLLPRF